LGLEGDYIMNLSKELATKSGRQSGIRALFILLFMVAVSGSDARAQLAFGLGGTSGDQGRAVAVDATGNTYITGFFNGTVAFDPSPGVEFELTAPPGAEAAFIASYDPAGALRYALSFKGEGNGIAVDDDGNVFAIGELGSGGVDVDPGPDEVLLDWLDGRVFVVSYDPNGNFRFGFNVGGGITNLVEAGKGIALDGSGNLYITGLVNDDTDFDPTVAGELIITNNGFTDSFLASYTNIGGLLFAIGIGGRFSDDGVGIATDPAGNSYLTGTFWDTVDFDPGPGIEPLVSVGNKDIYLASYTASGGFRFALSAGGGFDDLGIAVAVDATGNSFVTGAFKDQADFDPGPAEHLLTSAGNEDFYLASYTDMGDFRFAFGLGSSNPMLGYGIAVDDMGLPYVTGYFTNSVDFDPGPSDYTVSGTGDTFVAGYTNSGEFSFAYRFPDIGLQVADSGQGIALDSIGRTHVIGTFSNIKDFDPGPGLLEVTSNGNSDVFLSRNLSFPSAVGPDRFHVASATLTSGFPNPTSGQMRFNLAVQEASYVRVSVYDLAGRLVSKLQDGYLPSGAERTLVIAGESFPSGHYFVRLDDHLGSGVQRLVIVK
jgi:hypothetical protein